MTNTIDLKKEITAIAKETGYDFELLNVDYIAERLNLTLDKETKVTIANELQAQLVQSHVLKGSIATMTNTIDLKKEITAIVKATGYDFELLNVDYIAERLNLTLDKETKVTIASELQAQLVQSHVLKGSIV